MVDADPGAGVALVGQRRQAVGSGRIERRQGVGAGGVTFNVAAGYAETFASPTAGLLTLNNSSPNAGAATRPIAGASMVG